MKDTILVLLQMLISKGILDKSDLEFINSIPPMEGKRVVKLIEEKYPID